jgi:DUF4097 and DUF4098 domain-containing protein YvlB
MKTYLKYFIVAALTTLIALPAMAGVSGSYSTLNKSITIGDNAMAGSIDSVNGSIRIGANSFVDSIESVNGSIKLASDVTVEDSIEAVNGAITLESGCEVGERIESVNGAIRMENTRVAGDVETVNGALRIMDGSEISGNVLVRKPNSWGFNHRQKPVKVEIGENVVVHGNLVFEHAVELKLHKTARIGQIIGDEVTLVDGP